MKTRAVRGATPESRESVRDRVLSFSLSLPTLTLSRKVQKDEKERDTHPKLFLKTRPAHLEVRQKATSVVQTKATFSVHRTRGRCGPFQSASTPLD